MDAHERESKYATIEILHTCYSFCPEMRVSRMQVRLYSYLQLGGSRKWSMLRFLHLRISRGMQNDYETHGRMRALSTLHMQITLYDCI